MMQQLALWTVFIKTKSFAPPIQVCNQVIVAQFHTDVPLVQLYVLIHSVTIGKKNGFALIITFVELNGTLLLQIPKMSLI